VPIGAPRRPITAVVVIVPARDEAVSIAPCLHSIERAAAHCPGVETRVVVAADSCRDGTAAVARATSTVGLAVIEGRWRGASAARAAAARHALGAGDIDPGATWLAHTDADCTVPPWWLARQVIYAAGGVDAIAGDVVLDATASPRLQVEFAAAYERGVDAHRHVHGANLGVRADAYLAAGGWLARTLVGEDHDLWRRLARVGFRLAHPVHVTVATSPRRHGRVVGGFASWLARLEDPSGSAPGAVGQRSGSSSSRPDRSMA